MHKEINSIENREVPRILPLSSFRLPPAIQ